MRLFVVFRSIHENARRSKIEVWMMMIVRPGKRRQQHEKTFHVGGLCVCVWIVIDTKSFLLLFFCQTTEKSLLHFIYLVRVEFVFVCFCLIWRNNNATEAKRECEHDSIVGGHDFMGIRIFLEISIQLDKADVKKFTSQGVTSIWI